MANNTNPIPLNQIHTILQALLTNINIIEKTYTDICEINFDLVKNTITPYTYKARDIGNRANIRLLQQNKTENLYFIKQLKNKIGTLITSNTITSEDLNEIYTKYYLLDDMIKNANKNFNTTLTVSTEHLLEINKYITNLSKLNVDSQLPTGNALKTTFNINVKETINAFQSNPSLEGAYLAYYLYFHLRNMILKYKGDTTKLNKINQNFKEITRRGQEYILQEYKTSTDINKINTYASNYITSIETTLLSSNQPNPSNQAPPNQNNP